MAIGECVESMEPLSNFVENLKDLLFDYHFTVPMLAKELNISEVAAYSYLRGQLPDIAVLIKMADLFHCSLDFLLGRSPELQQTEFRAIPPFPQQLAFLLEYYHTNKYRLCKEIPITHSVIYNWQCGKFTPSLDYIVKLADHFGCSVDFVIGREK